MGQAAEHAPFVGDLAAGLDVDAADIVGRAGADARYRSGAASRIGVMWLRCASGTGAAGFSVLRQMDLRLRRAVDERKCSTARDHALHDVDRLV